MTVLQTCASDDETTEYLETPASEETLDGIGVEEQLQPDEHDGGYGWVCVVCQLMITASTWGVNGVRPSTSSPAATATATATITGHLLVKL
jgi:hypothetical protein